MVRKKRDGTAPQATVVELANRLKSVEALLHQMRTSEYVAHNEGMELVSASQQDESTVYVNSVSLSQAAGQNAERYSNCPFWYAICEQVR